jgi:hypothetical protein
VNRKWSSSQAPDGLDDPGRASSVRRLLFSSASVPYTTGWYDESTLDHVFHPFQSFRDTKKEISKDPFYITGTNSVGIRQIGEFEDGLE